SSLALDWTRHAPPTHPPPPVGAAMAYDAATGNAVLFGGTIMVGVIRPGSRLSSSTWTWDGSTWTRQAPASHPGARVGAAIAYDPATSNTWLFGGIGPHGVASNGTWTWDGSTWTRQAPATSPSARGYAAMAYDAAARNVVLFGGEGSHGFHNDTWIW